MTWTRTRVDRVATVNARIGWKALTASEYQPDGYAFLSTPNIKTESIDFDDVNYISEYRYCESPELKLRLGDVLLAKDGNTLGITNIVRELPRPATVNGSIAVLRPFDIEPRFLRYTLASSPTQGKIDAIKGGMGVPHLFQWDIKRLPLDMPRLAEQRRIADFLDAETARIDQIASLRSLQLTQLDEREKTWCASLFEQSKSGSRTRVKYLLRAKPRYGVLVPEFVDVGVPFIRVNSIFGLETLDGLPKIPEELSKQYARTVTGLGDILLSVVGTMGRATVVTEPLIGANVARAVAVIRLRPRHTPSLFTAWISTAEFEQQAQLATGADSAQPTLGMEDLANFALTWPMDDSEEGRMAQAVEERRLHVQITRTALTRQLSLLVERRQALITAAVTGGITV